MIKREESIEEIAKEMIACGLDIRFVNPLVKIAEKSEGAYDSNGNMESMMKLKKIKMEH